MPDERIVVTGAEGQLGRALRAVLPHAGFRSRSALDVTDPRALDDLGEAGVVVHAAAMTNVDACEADPATAAAVNDRGTAAVARAAHAGGATVVYLSTDYVFAGTDPPYAEDDPTGPVNVYGRTKLAGESHLDPARDLTIRTSWVFGEGRNFVRTILAAARTGIPRVVDDQVGRPTAAAMLARAVAYAIDRGLTGVLHVAGDGPPCSWAGLADAALERAGSAFRVERVDSASYAASVDHVVAPRPPDSTLDLSRARAERVPLEDWRTSLEDYLRGTV